MQFLPRMCCSLRCPSLIFVPFRAKYGRPFFQLLNVDSDQALAILTKHLPTVIRLRTGCPHCAVREWANELVSEIGATGCVDIPSYTEARASKYIPEDKVCDMKPSKYCSFTYLIALLVNSLS